ncbi:PTS fructose transporter subunit IIBC [Vibrio ostreicida]|uniref:PTS fructose transporter subunit IIBC n=1 Tax=Vibrio ostreicida TaxID=526588 RepID=UPI00097069B2|nr:PTS fructose transporter subunit IIBC [Vibrio ostreicida]
MNIAIVTACHNGVANSLIAGELLAKAACRRKHSVSLECQSQLFEPDALTCDQIERADVIIIASHNTIDMARFIGKKVYQSSILSVFSNPAALLQTAIDQAMVLHKSDIPQIEPSTSIPNGANIVAITACPTGVAHTFMAAAALETEAKSQGHHIKVETRGSVGAKNQLTESDIDGADVVIIAADIDVSLTRFEGKKVYKTSTSLALKTPAQELKKALSDATLYQQTDRVDSAPQCPESKGIYQHLMTGVSHMLPVVVAGGLIIALSFVFGIEAFKEEGTFAAALMTIGGTTAFALMIPVLAGFIAFSIADRPGLAPGLIGGMLASSIGAGFLGGIIAGFIAGYCAKLLTNKLRLPQSMDALKPILIIPFVASLFTGLVMIYFIGEPVAKVMSSMTTFLNTMGSTNAILLGVVLGTMMCFDLGGPVNKAAYTFGVGLLASQTYTPMAAIMAAGMVPALGMGLATFLAKNKFETGEREAGKASFVLGLCFISEGAIPFAAKDPLRVIPACILGGALTGALSMWFGAQLMAPHGGLFVLLIPNAISPVFMYLLAITAGTVVTGCGYALMKTRPLADTVHINQT